MGLLSTTSGDVAVRWHGLLHPLFLSRSTPARVLGKVLNRTVGAAVELLTGVTLPPQTRVGRGLTIHHRGKVVINADAVIGDACSIVHGVTIGNTVPGGPCPVIGDGVSIGAYAQVLGGITVGDGARIGALALVTQDVPPGAVMVAPRAVNLRERSPDSRG